MKNSIACVLLMCLAIISGLSLLQKAAKAIDPTAAENAPIEDHDAIKKVQEFFELKKVDGIIGGKTRTKIKEFQRNNGLDETGILDQKTFEAIMAKKSGDEKPVPIAVAQEIEMFKTQISDLKGQVKKLMDENEQLLIKNKELKGQSQVSKPSVTKEQYEKILSDKKRLSIFIWILTVSLTLSFIGIIALVFQTIRQNSSVKEMEKQITEKNSQIQKQESDIEQLKLIIDQFLHQQGYRPSNKKQWPPSSPQSWFILGESVIGDSHIKSNLPCQDNYHIEQVDPHWGIAVTADGAGTAKKSEIGSKYVAKTVVPQLFKKMIQDRKWDVNRKLPSDTEWKDFAETAMKSVKANLDKYAQKLGVEASSLACTVIVVVYSPLGLLVTHIGDGRAAYRTFDGKWEAMIKPFKGEEANATVFVTSNIWNGNLHQFIESHVIRERPSAFTLMSDGCEKSAFECSIMNPATQQWSDPNRPYAKFFEQLIETLVESHHEQTPAHEIQAKWRGFLEAGNENLRTEPDDKTMILGIIV